MKLPPGFIASGVRSGVRKRRPDLALIVAPEGATAAALFTRNRFAAAPVVLSKSAMRKSGGHIKGVVVNSGCANALTGQEGHAAARRVRTRAAQLLRCREEEIFLASTGVIGAALADNRIREALPQAVSRLSASGVEAASQAILTTDVGPKVAHATFRAGKKTGRIVGIAKGAGMIHPDMATMLVFLMTNAGATARYLQGALRDAADGSFHAISVDGDTSTNDTVLLLASGRLDAPTMTSPGDGEDFRRALLEVCRALAWMIVRDGEGATRVMEIEVRGASTQRDARTVAHVIATSPLVKTALHGGDPNWGRILAAVGRSGVRLVPSRVSLQLGRLMLVQCGCPVLYRERDAAKWFSKERVPIVINLGVGEASASMLTCDLGQDYVALNADYRS